MRLVGCGLHALQQGAERLAFGAAQQRLDVKVEQLRARGRQALERFAAQARQGLLHVAVGPVAGPLNALRRQHGHARHALQAGGTRQYVECGRQVARHAGKPSPRTVGPLQVDHLVAPGGQLQGQCGGVGQRLELVETLGLFFGIVGPGRFGRQNLAQVGVTAQQVACVPVSASGVGQSTEVRAYGRVALDEVGGQTGGIAGVGHRHGVGLAWLRQTGQGLEGVPEGIAGHLHRQVVGRVRTVRQDDGAVCSLLQAERRGRYRRFAVGQYGQVVLLAVGKVLPLGRKAAYHERPSARGNVEGKGGRGVGLQGEFLLLLADDFSAFGVGQQQGGRTLLLAVGRVAQQGRYGSFVALTYEARQVRLQGKVLLSHNRCIQAAPVHPFVVGNGLETP